ncbi:TKL protein kinase [Salpingoeca rosetta]|uniref:TKL protein kinase n=1 Tax=Salpingoeca rosetta (strain ATCC 50818 / BSB-021) TaxID=946362 RepID=F2UR61_SALR5|nr:TKL protein kinase [Salpingoeca rosetta]EGD80116.1 TKL protein kinase [Salpingoeca rosetta]|eukprot:XP_004988441.1 TKL protein kinase [Salpingoeca rosetta]
MAGTALAVVALLVLACISSAAATTTATQDEILHFGFVDATPHEGNHNHHHHRHDNNTHGSNNNTANYGNGLTGSDALLALPQCAGEDAAHSLPLGCPDHQAFCSSAVRRVLASMASIDALLARTQERPFGDAGGEGAHDHLRGGAEALRLTQHVLRELHGDFPLLRSILTQFCPDIRNTRPSMRPEKSNKQPRPASSPASASALPAAEPIVDMQMDTTVPKTRDTNQDAAVLSQGYDVASRMPRLRPRREDPDNEKPRHNATIATCSLQDLVDGACNSARQSATFSIFFRGFLFDPLDGDTQAANNVLHVSNNVKPTRLRLHGTIPEDHLRLVIDKGAWNYVTEVIVQGWQPGEFDLGLLRGLPLLTHVQILDSELVGVQLSSTGDAGDNNELVALEKRLVLLNLTSNSLTNLHPGLFANMENLMHLWLNDNQVTALDENVFEKLSTLQTLSLRNNRISEIDDKAFTGLTNLQRLGLGYNALSSLKEDVFEPLTSLQALFLENNPIERLKSETFKKLSNLLRLELTFSPLNVLSDELFKYTTRLQQLILRQNRFETLPEDVFHPLTNLETLDLSHNRLTFITQSHFKHQAKLTHLLLLGNRITTIAFKAFGQLTSLKRLDLQHNDLTLVDAVWFDRESAQHIEELELSSNKLTQFPPDLLDMLDGLRVLSIAKNKLTKFVPPLVAGRTFGLRHLRLSDNPLDTFPSLGSFPQLRELEANNHMIPQVNVTPVLNVTSLRALEVAAHPHNKGVRLIVEESALKELMSETGKPLLENLRHLDLRNVDITAALKLPLSHLQLTHLRLGWEGMAETTFPASNICELLGQHVEEIELTGTHYTDLEMCENKTFSSILLTENKLLRTVTVRAHLRQLNLSGCSDLHDLFLPSAELLDISGTRLHPDPGLCNGWGRSMLFARNWKNEHVQQNQATLRLLLARCLQTVDLIDLGANDWLDEPDKVKDVVSPLTVLSKRPVFTENGVQLRSRETMPVFLLENTPIACGLHVSNARVSLSREPQNDDDDNDNDNNNDDQQSTRVAYTFQCSCAGGYHKGNNNRCVRDNRDQYLLLFGALFGVLVVQAVVFVVVRYVRRHRQLVQDHTLKTQLLVERDEEVLALKKAWEIGYNELRSLTHISTGAFGTVYKAEWDTVTVAVKVMQQGVSIFDDNSQHEFEKEVEFLQRTRHPHVVRFFGAGTHPNGSPFLVLEFVAMGSLKQLLFDRGLEAVLQEHLRERERANAAEGSEQGGGRSNRTYTTVDVGESVMVTERPTSTVDMPELPLSSWGLRQRLARDVACGMAFIHSLDQVHRDLKSGNVLVSAHLRAKISDFGSIRQKLATGARHTAGTNVDGKADENSIKYSRTLGATTMHLTMTAGVGTPMYMAPEALYGHEYGLKADVFSFGVLLWEIACVQHPDIISQEYGDSFDGPLFPTLKQLLEDGKRLKFSDEAASQTPTWYRALTYKCMAQDPDGRPSFKQLKTNLM